VRWALLVVWVAACGFAPRAAGVGDDITVDGAIVDAAIGDANQMVGPCGSPGAIRDNFDDPAVSPMWNVDTQGGTAAEQASRLVVTPTGTAFTGYISKHYIDLTGAAIEVEVPKMLDTTTNAIAEIFVEADVTHFVAMSQKHGVLLAELSNGGSPTTMTMPYDPIAHRFWRISEAAGQVHFEASPDGLAWTQILMATTPPFITAVRIDLGVTGDPGMPSSGSVAFDNLNTQVPIAGWCKADTLHDAFNRNGFGLAWANHYTSASGCNPSINNGAHFDQGGVPTVCYIGTSHAFDLTDSSAVVLITAITNYKPGWTTFLAFARDDAQGAHVTFDNGQMCAATEGGMSTCHAYATTEIYWRIRETAGTLAFETSGDQVTWRLVTSVADPFAIDAVEIRIGTQAKTNLGATPIGLTVSSYN
jgi:hypothetical protein